MKKLSLWTPGKIHTQSHHCKCSWCEYGRDPGPEWVCFKCYEELKALLRGSMWAKLRQARLQSFDTAMCVDPFNCHGVLEPGYIIDHIQPWKLKPSLFWDESNHQTLCKACHNRKTQTDGSYTNGRGGSK